MCWRSCNNLDLDNPCSECVDEYHDDLRDAEAINRLSAAHAAVLEAVPASDREWRERWGR